MNSYGLDLLNKRFGRWLVIDKTTNKHKQPVWLCSCDCGNERLLLTNKGYIIGNVQWVHRDINRMKWGMTEDVFIRWCKRVASN